MRTLSIMEALHAAGVDVNSRVALIDYVRMSGLPYTERLSLLERIEKETGVEFTPAQWTSIS